MALGINPDLYLSVEGWLTSLKNGRGISTHTETAYRSDLGDFLHFLQNHHAEIPDMSMLSKLTPRDTRAFMAECQRRDIGAASRNRKLSAIKGFFRYLQTHHGIENEALLMSRSAKKPERLPRPLSMQDADAAIGMASGIDKRRWVNARDSALLTLLYAAGLRISEALSITAAQTPLSTELRIRGKGNKTRIVPVLPLARTAMDDYLDVCPYVLKPEDPVFRAIRGGVMSSRAAAKLMEQIRINLGLPSTATPHSMRHSFASHLLAAGGDIRSIQELLGHSSLSATQVYTKLDEAQLLDVYRNAHPKGRD